MTVDQTIEIGSIVRLNSGGPQMSVIGMCGTMCNCEWWFSGLPDQCAEVKSAEFDLACLKIVKDAPSTEGATNRANLQDSP